MNGGTWQARTSAALIIGAVGISYTVAGGSDPAYCAQRYRSYDPASGTYLGYDGLRHLCGE